MNRRKPSRQKRSSSEERVPGGRPLRRAMERVRSQVDSEQTMRKPIISVHGRDVSEQEIEFNTREKAA